MTVGRRAFPSFHVPLPSFLSQQLIPGESDEGSGIEAGITEKMNTEGGELNMREVDRRTLERGAMEAYEATNQG